MKIYLVDLINIRRGRRPIYWIFLARLNKYSYPTNPRINDIIVHFPYVEINFDAVHDVTTMICPHHYFHNLRVTEVKFGILTLGDRLYRKGWILFKNGRIFADIIIYISWHHQITKMGIYPYRNMLLICNCACWMP